MEDFNIMRIRFPEIYEDVYQPGHPLFINYEPIKPPAIGTSGIDVAWVMLQVIVALVTIMVILSIAVIIRGL